MLNTNANIIITVAELDIPTKGYLNSFMKNAIEWDMF